MSGVSSSEGHLELPLLLQASLVLEPPGVLLEEEEEEPGTGQCEVQVFPGKPSMSHPCTLSRR